MELIVLNIGRERGVLPPMMVTILVLMAVGTTFVATPLIRLLIQDERQPVAYMPQPARAV